MSGHNPKARRSTDSVVSDGEPSSPLFAPSDSTARLILVNDEVGSNSRFDFSSDEDGEFDSHFDVRRASIPPLSPLTVYLFLLLPYLKLGALSLPNSGLDPKYAIPLALFFALLSWFTRQIWCKLARYTRKSDLEDVVLQTLARSRDRDTEKTRKYLRIVIRLCTGFTRVLLAKIYLQQAVNVILGLIYPRYKSVLRVQVYVCTLILLLPLCTATNLASKRVIWASSLSIASYVFWLGCVSYSYAVGILPHYTSWRNRGVLLQPITLFAFTFAVSPTLPLYFSLKASAPQHVATTRHPKSRSFKIVSAIAVLTSLVLVVPLVFFNATSNAPCMKLCLRDVSAVGVLDFTDSFLAATLLLSIPFIVVTTPNIQSPVRIRRSLPFSLTKVLTVVVIFIVAILPRVVSEVLNDVLLVLVLAGTYFVPALVHVIFHYVRRPISIIVPPQSQPQTPAPRQEPTTPGPSAVTETPLPPPTSDELLQRKERSLQSRLQRKRLVWDFGVWMLLIPVGGGGFVWAVGRIAGQW